MKRLLLFAPLFAFAACKSDVTEPSYYDPQFAKGGQPGAEVVATVTGHFDRDQPARQQKASLVAQLLADGSARGFIRLFFHSVLPGGAFISADLEEVTCLVIEGNTAWIGSTVVVDSDDANLGIEVVTQIVDRGVGDDLAQVGLKDNVGACTTRPELGLVPLFHGEIRIHDRR